MTTKLTGYHAILEALRGGLNGTLYVSRKNDRIEEIIREAGKSKAKIKRTDDHFLDKWTGGKEHRGCVFEYTEQNYATHERRAYSSISDFIASQPEGKSLVLVLDEITDPHNIGAILRSADCFSVSLVIFPERRSGSLNETVHRISAGAAAWIPTLTVNNISRTLSILKEKGFWIYGADMNGEDCRTLKFADKSVLVLGSEGSGLHRLVREHCDHIVSIPLSGHVDSLNVSVATGILLYEFSR